jgi:hypothetical protein
MMFDMDYEVNILCCVSLCFRCFWTSRDPKQFLLFPNRPWIGTVSFGHDSMLLIIKMLIY